MTYSVRIPYGAYWSTPFAKWQGGLAHLNSVTFAAWVARRELEARSIAVDKIDHAILGMTLPQHHSFYGAPWLTGLFQGCAAGDTAMAVVIRVRDQRKGR